MLQPSAAYVRARAHYPRKGSGGGDTVPACCTEADLSCIEREICTVLCTALYAVLQL
jgi:hypothetical protein